MTAQWCCAVRCGVLEAVENGPFLVRIDFAGRCSMMWMSNYQQAESQLIKQSLVLAKTPAAVPTQTCRHTDVHKDALALEVGRILMDAATTTVGCRTVVHGVTRRPWFTHEVRAACCLVCCLGAAES
eukprot:jgi/Ulvmu1/7854/UM004_0085.1